MEKQRSDVRVQFEFEIDPLTNELFKPGTKKVIGRLLGSSIEQTTETTEDGSTVCNVGPMRFTVQGEFIPGEGLLWVKAKT